MCWGKCLWCGERSEEGACHSACRLEIAAIVERLGWLPANDPPEAGNDEWTGVKAILRQELGDQLVRNLVADNGASERVRQRLSKEADALMPFDFRKPWLWPDWPYSPGRPYWFRGKLKK